MQESASVPSSVAGLARLRCAHFTWWVDFSEAPAPPALPVGPWAGCLQQLGAPYQSLLLSDQLLAAAGRLEQLTVYDTGCEAAPDGAKDRFWRWCGSHPPLRHLRAEDDSKGGEPALFGADVEELGRTRPALLVEWFDGSEAIPEGFSRSL